MQIFIYNLGKLSYHFTFWTYIGAVTYYPVYIRYIALRDVACHRAFKRRHSISVLGYLADISVFYKPVQRACHICIPRAYTVDNVDAFVLPLLKMHIASRIVDEGRKGVP